MGVKNDDRAGSASSGLLSFPNPGKKIAFTGERYVSGITGPIQHEHYHRYLFAATLCRGRTVLDIASGEGYGCYLLAQAAAEVVGVDIDVETVRYAESQYASPKLRFLVGDATAIPVPTGSVDVVTSFETIEHFQDHELFLAEVARVLRPGGLLIISSPNRPVYTEQNQHHNPFHFRELDREEFRSALRKQFPNVAIYEQRSIYGSAIAAERTTQLGVDGFESANGLEYRQSVGLPSPHYFVALATAGALPQSNNNLLFDGAHLGELHSSISALTTRVGDAENQAAALRARLTQEETEVARLSDRAEKAERQTATLRASLAAWAEEAAIQEEKTSAAAIGIARALPIRRFLDKLGDLWRSRRAKREFDAGYYLRQNPDVAAARIDPLRHYLRTGWKEGRDPSAGFSTAYYLETNEDVP